MLSQCPAKDAAPAQTGCLVWSASLDSPQAALALRPHCDKTHVTGRPYAKAKEMVGGFFIIEAADRDEAVRVASLHPAATLGESVGWGLRCTRLEVLNQERRNSLVFRAVH